MLFAKANAVNCNAIREVIDTFCKCPGQIVSDSKFRVYFSPIIDQDDREAFSDILGKYLGFPIKH